MSDKMHESSVSSTPGQLLRAARESRSLSQADIAKHTRLSVQAVDDLENDEYTHFGARTFVRGYLSAYARLVGIAEEKILESLEASGLMPGVSNAPSMIGNGAPVLNVTHQRSSSRSRYSRWVAAGVSLLLLIGLVAWWQSQKDDTMKQVASKMKSTPEVTTQTNQQDQAPQSIVLKAETKKPIKATEQSMQSQSDEASDTLLANTMTTPKQPTAKKVVAKANTAKQPVGDNADTKANLLQTKPLAALHTTYTVSPAS